MAKGDEEKLTQPHGREHQKRISFNTLNLHHPLHSALDGKRHLPCEAPHDMVSVEGKKIKKGEPTISNQCAVRLAVTLIRAGVSLDTKKILTCGVPGHEGHTVRAFELAQLIETSIRSGNIGKDSIPGLQPARKLSRNKQLPNGMNEVEAFFSIPTENPGLIYVKGYWQRPNELGRTGDHIDLWNGYRTPAKPIGNYFTRLGAVTNYANADEVWFWEIKSNEPINTPKFKKTEIAPSQKLSSSVLEFDGSVVATDELLTRNDPFTDFEGEIKSKSVELRRREVVKTGVLAVFQSVFGDIFSTTAHAEPKKGKEGVEERSKYRSEINSFQKKIEKEGATLKNILSHPEVPHIESLSQSERDSLFARVNLGYLSAQEEKEKGLLSFPMVPIRNKPQSVYDATKEYRTTSELLKDPLSMIFDDSFVYWNAVRTGSTSLVSPSLWLHAAQGRTGDMPSLLREGPHTLQHSHSLSATYNQAGILQFDKVLAMGAHGKWTNLLWLKNPDVTENGSADNNPRRQWVPQIAGGFTYVLSKAPELKSALFNAIKKNSEAGSSLQKLQSELLLTALEKSQAFIPSSTDIAHFDNTMQQMTGAAVVCEDESRTPRFVGSSAWTIPLKDTQGKNHLVILHTDF